jgi:hypothetical protein
MGRGYWVWLIPLGSGSTSIAAEDEERLKTLAQTATALRFLVRILGGTMPEVTAIRMRLNTSTSTQPYALAHPTMKGILVPRAP